VHGMFGRRAQNFSKAVLGSLKNADFFGGRVNSLIPLWNVKGAPKARNFFENSSLLRIKEKCK